MSPPLSGPAASGERAARVVLAAVSLALVAAATSADLPRLSGGAFWGDGATYYAMAWSLAEDGDLRYEAEDLLRVRREFPGGPQGVFLKRASGGLAVDADGSFPWVRRVPEDAPRLYFAKPYAYPLAAAPLVRLLGTRGLLLTNGLCLAAALVLSYAVVRRRAGPGPALALALVVVLGTVAPVYALWPAPEVFNMALVAGGLAAWAFDRPLLSAVLLGVATYSKPYNLWLAIPLGLAPLVSAAAGERRRAVVESLRRAAVHAATVIALFGVNAAVTGEANYQGGRERKTFYGKFPGDVEMVEGRPREVTFGNSGTWMSTNTAGPRIEGVHDEKASQGAEPPRTPAEIRQSFVRNLGYFWVGRFGGVLPYFPPAVLAVALFLLAGPRDGPGWLCVTALVVSWLFYLWMIPDNWYGGSGTVGNRYFLNLLPLTLFLVPRGREVSVAAASLGVAALFVGPILLAPMHHSLHHGAQATSGAFRLLPAELTMLNDLGIFTEGWRKKQSVGDTEGDRWRHWPADPRAYYLYFPDDGTYGREDGPQGPGFWLRGGAEAEVIVRALEPVRGMTLRILGGPAGDALRIRLGGRRASLAVAPGLAAEVTLEAGGGFVYKDSFVHVLRLASTRAGRAGADPRFLGAFVRIELDVAKRE
ncbi:MAG: hypothetical protein HY317_03385 [Acidobacteria bacterium]|nr:hypothetical protein [Acidobacteriota bacterium]